MDNQMHLMEIGYRSLSENILRAPWMKMVLSLVGVTTHKVKLTHQLVSFLISPLVQDMLVL